MTFEERDFLLQAIDVVTSNKDGAGPFDNRRDRPFISEAGINVLKATIRGIAKDEDE